MKRACGRGVRCGVGVRGSCVLLVLSLMLLACVFVPGWRGGASASVQEGAGELTLARVLANVRKAVGHERRKRLRQGFVVEEAGKDWKAEEVKVSAFGAAGEYREDSLPQNSRPLGFDGRFGWQVDRTGLAAHMPQRLREKLLIPAWIRGGWWLDERAPFVYSILTEETNDRRVALSMRVSRRGLVGAKVFVDRTTWLPESFVVEYERGPYTVTLRDYQETLGFRFAHTSVVNYRGSDSELKVRSVREARDADTARFAAPQLPSDTVFDNTLPAELQVAQGVAFSADTPGHYYVRPLVDGRDVGWFHFDTGGDAMYLDAKFADEMKMPVLGKSMSMGADGKPQEVTIRQGKTLQLGRVTFKNPLYLSTDLSDKNAPPGTRRAGLIGHPLLARVVVEVTGGGRKIALYDPATYKLPRGKWQELSYIDLTPAVVCRFEGNREGLFQLDTGYTGTVTFYDKFIRDEKLLEGRAVKEQSSFGSGGNYKLLAGTVEWFELAGVRFKQPRAGFRVAGLSREGGAGVVGREFLAPFTVVFNYPARRIAFLKD